MKLFFHMTVFLTVETFVIDSKGVHSQGAMLEWFRLRLSDVS